MNANKSVEIYDPLPGDGIEVYALPENDVIYTITIDNAGNGPSDTDSLFLVDRLPSDMTFLNGDIDDAGPETNPVSFTDFGSTGVTFTYATDVAFSDAATKPADFASCSYTPTSGYDPAVKYICFNPKGAFAAGNPDPSMAFSFRARIN